MSVSRNTSVAAPDDAALAVAEPSRWRYLRVAGRVVTTLLVSGLVVLAVLTVVVPRVLGAVPLAVLSGSMEPALSPGDLIVSRPVDTDDIAVGDVITFQPESNDPTLITHRVVGLTLGADGITGFTTRGDANDVDDDPIVAEQVMGRVAYSIPLVGNVTSTGWAPQVATVLAVGLLVYGLFTFVLPDRSRKPRDAQGAPSSNNREEAHDE